MFLLLNDCPSTQTIRNKRWKERTIVRVDTLDISVQKATNVINVLHIFFKKNYTARSCYLQNEKSMLEAIFSMKTVGLEHGVYLSVHSSLQSSWLSLITCPESTASR